jgi:GNAT superfamily N-acetyltransferase
MDQESTIERALRQAPRQLVAADAAALLALQSRVLERQPPGTMRQRSGDELASYLDGRAGLALGILAGSQLVAAALLRLPAGDDPMAQLPMPQVPLDDWPAATSLLESAMVHPSWRGLGLQRRLIAARRRAALDAGRRWVCAGVALRNPISLHNLLANGLAIVGMRRLPHGTEEVDVFGLLQPADGTRLASDPGDARAHDIADTGAHQAALAAGYIGVALDAGAVAWRRAV